MHLGANFSLIGRLVEDPKITINGRGVQTGQWADKADSMT